MKLFLPALCYYATAVLSPRQCGAPSPIFLTRVLCGELSFLTGGKPCYYLHERAYSGKGECGACLASRRRVETQGGKRSQISARVLALLQVGDLVGRSGAGAGEKSGGGFPPFSVGGCVSFHFSSVSLYVLCFDVGGEAERGNASVFSEADDGSLPNGLASVVVVVLLV